MPDTQGQIGIQLIQRFQAECRPGYVPVQLGKTFGGRVIRVRFVRQKRPQIQCRQIEFALHPGTCSAIVKIQRAVERRLPHVTAHAFQRDFSRRVLYGSGDTGLAYRGPSGLQQLFKFSQILRAQRKMDNAAAV